MNLERNIEALVSKGQELIAYAATSVAQTSVIRHLAQYNSRAVVWFQGTIAGQQISSENVAFVNKVFGNLMFIVAINSLSETVLARVLANKGLSLLKPFGLVTKFVIRAVVLTGTVLTSTAIFGGSLPVIGGIAGVYLLVKTYTDGTSNAHKIGHMEGRFEGAHKEWKRSVAWAYNTGVNGPQNQQDISLLHSAEIHGPYHQTPNRSTFYTSIEVPSRVRTSVGRPAQARTSVGRPAQARTPVPVDGAENTSNEAPG